MKTPCFIFQQGNILFLRENDQARLPTLNEVSPLLFLVSRKFQLPHMTLGDVFVGELDAAANLPTTLYFQTLRAAFEMLDAVTQQQLGKASQILHWHHTNQYCGKCGAKNNDSEVELAKVCSKCAYVVHSRISPSIIVLITRGDKLLLARSPHFPSKRFSTLAGFVEPGETVEEAVHREVMEEVSIEIQNLRYIGSQPWPFPHSLMLAYRADYKAGEIKIDGVEIEAADWFTKDNLPELPSSISIARYLIDAFLQEH